MPRMIQEEQTIICATVVPPVSMIPLDRDERAE